MDIMMILSTEDVKRLKQDFVEPLNLEKFVDVMEKCLRGHISNEVNFAVQAIELFETIDINGDGDLEWDEFLSFIVDAGNAKGSSSSVGPTNKYRLLKLEDSPVLAQKTYIENILHLWNSNSIAIQEHGSGNIQIYSLSPNSDEQPSHMCDIRHHTTFQAHKLISMGYAAARGILASSSQYASQYFLNFWDISRLQTPILLSRIEVPSPQHALVWCSSIQLLITSTLEPALPKPDNQKSKRKKDSVKMYGWNLSHFTQDEKWKLNLPGIIYFLELSMKAKSYLAAASVDGTISLCELVHPYSTKSIDAHETGVKSINYSKEFEFLISFGNYSSSSESSLSLLIWEMKEDLGKLMCQLRGHQFPIVGVEVIDSESHFISGDVNGNFLVWSSHTKQIFQKFSASFTRLGALHSMLTLPSTLKSNAILFATGKRIEIFEFNDGKEREEIIFCAYNTVFNKLISITGSFVVLFDAVTGRVSKKYDNKMLFNSDKTHQITAACMDDRQRKFILGDDFGNVFVYNLANGNLMKQFDPHSGSITSLMYIDEAKCVVSTSMDSRIRIFDENNAVGYYKPIVGEEFSVNLRSITLIAPKLKHTKGKCTNKIAQHVTDGTTNFSLRLIATHTDCGQESYLQIWDYEFASLLGTCALPNKIKTKKDNSVNIMCFRFLSDYPAIIAGTNTGEIYMWGVRGSNLEYQCIAQFILHSQPDLLHSVTTLLVVSEDEQKELVIFSGNDCGHVTSWRISSDVYGKDEKFRSIFKESEEREQHDRNVHSKILYKDSVTSYQIAKKDNTLIKELTQFYSFNKWSAHDESISFLSYIEDIGSLIIASSAGRIVISNKEGDTQGVIDVFETIKQPVVDIWRVPIDITTIEQRKREKASIVLSQIKHRKRQDRLTKLHSRICLPVFESIVGKFDSNVTSMSTRRESNYGDNKELEKSPRTSKRLKSLFQITPEEPQSQDLQENSENIPLDRVLREIEDFKPSTSLSSRTLLRKKLSKNLNSSSSAPTLYRQGSKICAPLKLQQEKIVYEGKHNIKKRFGRLDLAPKLPPISSVQSSPCDSVKASTLGYHMKLAHIWQNYER